MANYIPTTEEVRAGYRRIGGTTWYEGKADAIDAQFDRWLAEVKEQAWDEGFREGLDGDRGDPNPYRQGEN